MNINVKIYPNILGMCSVISPLGNSFFSISLENMLMLLVFVLFNPSRLCSMCDNKFWHCLLELGMLSLVPGRILIHSHFHNPLTTQHPHLYKMQIIGVRQQSGMHQESFSPTK